MKSICKSCGRTIDSEFLYCPWCGESRLEPEDRESMNAVFTRLVDAREEKISKMKNQLDELDKELSNIALSVEMHR